MCNVWGLPTVTALSFVQLWLVSTAEQMHVVMQLCAHQVRRGGSTEASIPVWRNSPCSTTTCILSTDGNAQAQSLCHGETLSTMRHSVTIRVESIVAEALRHCPGFLQNLTAGWAGHVCICRACGPQHGMLRCICHAVLDPFIWRLQPKGRQWALGRSTTTLGYLKYWRWGGT